MKDFFDVAPAEKAIKGIYEQFVPVDIQKANKNSDNLQKFQLIEKIFEHLINFKKAHETDDIKLSVSRTRISYSDPLVQEVPLEQSTASVEAQEHQSPEG